MGAHQTSTPAEYFYSTRREGGSVCSYIIGSALLSADAGEEPGCWISPAPESSDAVFTLRGLQVPLRSEHFFSCLFLPFFFFTRRLSPSFEEEVSLPLSPPRIWLFSLVAMPTAFNRGPFPK